MVDSAYVRVCPGLTRGRPYVERVWTQALRPGASFAPSPDAPFGWANRPVRRPQAGIDASYIHTRAHGALRVCRMSQDSLFDALVPKELRGKPLPRCSTPPQSPGALARAEEYMTLGKQLLAGQLPEYDVEYVPRTSPTNSSGIRLVMSDSSHSKIECPPHPEVSPWVSKKASEEFVSTTWEAAYTYIASQPDSGWEAADIKASTQVAGFWTLPGYDLGKGDCLKEKEVIVRELWEAQVEATKGMRKVPDSEMGKKGDSNKKRKTDDAAAAAAADEPTEYAEELFDADKVRKVGACACPSATVAIRVSQRSPPHRGLAGAVEALQPHQHGAERCPG